MRNRQAYLDAKRNDPLSDQQRREHPYDFVSLPERPASGQAVSHERYAADRWSGTVELVYRTLSPLHVGSGVFETAEDCGLQGGSKPVRGVVRQGGRPVLPGSSWKGAVRARFEAITRSRLALRPKGGSEPAFKVPEALKRPGDPSRNYSVDLKDPCLNRLGPARIKKGDLSQLSPADALFGAMGYRGRIRPGEGVIDGPSALRPLIVAPLDSPVTHRIAKPGKIENVGGNRLAIHEVEGRKFYYDGDVVHERRTEMRGNVRVSSEDIDHVPEGATITVEVHLDSVSGDELGALLIAAGHGTEVGVVRFGGYKSVGLGKVVLEKATSRLHRGADLSRWRRAEPMAVELDELTEGAIGSLVDPELLRELHEVTTRRRPPEVKR